MIKNVNYKKIEWLKIITEKCGAQDEIIKNLKQDEIRVHYLCEEQQMKIIY